MNDGTAVTRLLGRLKILHSQGVIEFELRSPHAIGKLGARRILRIEGLGYIPQLEDGTTINIDYQPFGNAIVKFEKTDENIEEILADRRGRSI